MREGVARAGFSVACQSRSMRNRERINARPARHPIDNALDDLVRALAKRAVTRDYEASPSLNRNSERPSGGMKESK